MEYEPTIGLEVHVQLKTRSKVFSPSGYQFGAEVNTLTDPVVLGLPGTLPVMNAAAVRQCVKLGLMLGCRIADHCKWDRKNYFYPDLPKNYQISQYDEPLCIGGEVEIELAGPSRAEMGEHRTVQLTRIHLEEDPGKLDHGSLGSLIDYNRAGVPLAEIVTEPCLTTSDEAVALLNALRLLMTYADISDCDMEKGQLRCDANVSIKPKGSTKLGTRTEMKNLNSISNVKDAIEFEIRRQTQELLRGGAISQETRRWDAARNESFPLRSKEDVHDYRYFPDPDLMPVVIDEATLSECLAELPERPYEKQRRYIDNIGLPYTTANVLIADRELADFYETALAAASDQAHAKAIANLVANNLLAELSANAEEGQGRLPLADCPIQPAQLAALVQLIEDGAVVKDAALKQVFPEMFKTGDDPEIIIEVKGLRQQEDTGELEALCRETLANPKFEKAINQYKDGNEKALNSLMGPIMKATGGKANPPKVIELLKKLVAEG